jgi:hypothetical protein
VEVKLTDFGIGQVVSQEVLAGITKTGFTQTIVAESSSSHTGSQMYMAPELLAGKSASTRSDIYSLGVVLYQLLAGDFTRPVTTDWAENVLDPLLGEDLKRCFAGDPDERFESAELLARSLRSLDRRQGELANQQATQAARQLAAMRWRRMRLVGVASVMIALVAGLIWFSVRGAKVRWARETALPEITRLAKEGRMGLPSHWRNRQKACSDDPALTNLWSQISVRAIIETAPAGAEVYYKEYRSPDSPWHYIGKSPLKSVHLPRGFLRWHIKKAGYVPAELAWYALPDPQFPGLGGTNSFTLGPPEADSGMVYVKGGETGLLLTGLDHVDGVQLEDYLIDKFEVSNRQFKEFVDAGGYTRTNFWKVPSSTKPRHLPGRRLQNFAMPLARQDPRHGRTVPIPKARRITRSQA